MFSVTYSPSGLSCSKYVCVYVYYLLIYFLINVFSIQGSAFGIGKNLLPFVVFSNLSDFKLRDELNSFNFLYMYLNELRRVFVLRLFLF